MLGSGAWLGVDGGTRGCEMGFGGEDIGMEFGGGIWGWGEGKKIVGVGEEGGRGVVGGGWRGGGGGRGV